MCLNTQIVFLKSVVLFYFVTNGILQNSVLFRPPHSVATKHLHDVFWALTVHLHSLSFYVDQAKRQLEIAWWKEKFWLGNSVDPRSSAGEQQPTSCPQLNCRACTAMCVSWQYFSNVGGVWMWCTAKDRAWFSGLSAEFFDLGKQVQISSQWADKSRLLFLHNLLFVK